MDDIKELSKTMNEVKSTVEYESKFSKEHRTWMVNNINEIKQDVQHINGRVRSTEVSVGWLKGLIGMITAVVGWIIRKEM